MLRCEKTIVFKMLVKMPSRHKYGNMWYQTKSRALSTFNVELKILTSRVGLYFMILALAQRLLTKKKTIDRCMFVR